MSAVGVSIARAARVSRAYSSVAAAQSQTVACFGPLYTKPTKSPLSSFTTSSDAHTRQPLRTPLPTATFNTMYAQTLAGPLHKRASVSGPSVSEPLPRATGAGEACKGCAGCKHGHRH